MTLHDGLDSYGADLIGLGLTPFEAGPPDVGRLRRMTFCDSVPHVADPEPSLKPPINRWRRGW